MNIDEKLRVCRAWRKINCRDAFEKYGDLNFRFLKKYRKWILAADGFSNGDILDMLDLDLEYAAACVKSSKDAALESSCIFLLKKSIGEMALELAVNGESW